MPSGFGPWQAEDAGRGLTGLLALGIFGTIAGCVYWLMADTPFLPVCLGVLAAVSLAGMALVVRNVARDRGALWRGQSESLLVQCFRLRRPVRAADRPAVTAVPSPAELPVRGRTTLVARQVAPGHFSVIPETALNVAPSGSDTTT